MSTSYHTARIRFYLLLGGVKHFLFFISYMGYIVLPIDELHHFSRCFFNHQPAWDWDNSFPNHLLICGSIAEGFYLRCFLPSLWWRRRTSPEWSCCESTGATGQSAGWVETHPLEGRYQWDDLLTSQDFFFFAGYLRLALCSNTCLFCSWIHKAIKKGFSPMIV